MEVEAYLNVLEAWANELPATLATNSRHKHRAIKAAIELMEKHAQLPQKIALLPPSAQLILSESNEGTDESEDKDNSEDDDSQDTHSDAANSDNSTDRVAGGIEIRAHPLEIRTVYLTDIWWTGDPLYIRKLILKWPNKQATEVFGPFNRTANLHHIAQLAEAGDDEDYDYFARQRLQAEVGRCAARLIWFDTEEALIREQDYDLETSWEYSVGERADKLTVKTRLANWRGEIPAEADAEGIDVGLILQNHLGWHHIPSDAISLWMTPGWENYTTA